MLKKNRSAPNTAVIPVLYYLDESEAVDWLTTGPAIRRLSPHRRQSVSTLAQQWRHRRRQTRRTRQRCFFNTAEAGAHSITDALFQRAKAAGARVLAEPADHMYGECQCSFLDRWEHPWTLSNTIFDSDPADWGGELLVE